MMNNIRIHKFISITILTALLLSIFVIVVPAHAELSQDKSEMQIYADAMQPGWNLGNTFDASGSETAWGNPTTTKQLIDKLVDEGYKSIRIPITWDHRMGDAPDYTVDPESMERIQEVIDWALDSGLYVIINLHHDSHWIIPMETEHDEILAKFNALWTQIAAHFKDYPSTLSFESINEPRFSDDWGKDRPKYFTMLDELNTSFHRIVRSSEGNNAKRPLILPTMTGSPSQARLDNLYQTMTTLDDKNLIATFHFYGFYNFSVNQAGYTTFNDEVKNDLIDAFDRAYNVFTAKGIPVILGEFGLLGFDKFVDTIQQGEKLKYMEFLTYYAKEKGFPHFIWDNGQHYNRRTLEWRDKDLAHVLMASLTGRSSNAETDSIYLKKGSAIEDTIIQLNLNGNTLLDVSNGDEILVRGQDYEINGEMITLKANLLESLVTNILGSNATLTAKFSAGADWKFHVINYDTPILKSTNGFITGFSIPTNFNGDKLATMEAIYTSGGNAGPNDWTSFKEFGSMFNPVYSSNEIKILPDFFKQVRNGEVLLKMHFWSGSIVEYTISKDQSSIVGVSSFEPEVENEDVSTEQEDIVATDSSQETTENGKQGANNHKLLIWLAVGILVLVLIGIGIYATKRKKFNA
jgi:endoglucanase